MSYGFVELDKAFSKGYVKILVVTGATPTATRISPPVGKRWMILSGHMQHVTGTDTYVAVSTETLAHYYMKFIGNAVASCSETLFSTGTDGLVSHNATWCPVIITDQMTIAYQSDSGSLRLEVLEW